MVVQERKAVWLARKRVCASGGRQCSQRLSQRASAVVGQLKMSMISKYKQRMHTTLARSAAAKMHSKKNSKKDMLGSQQSRGTQKKKMKLTTKNDITRFMQIPFKL